MSRRIFLSGVAAMAALSLLSAPAGAVAPDDRLAAREFSYAAYHLRVALKASFPEMRRRLDVIEAPGCIGALEPVPERVQDAASSLFLAAVFDAILGPATPALGTFAAELQRVAVGDPALRSGRATWRRLVARYAALPPLPADFCAQYARWREAGYARSARPAVDTGPVSRLLEDESSGGERKLDAAARRMRQLGVAPGAADRFGGDSVFDGIPEPDLDDV